MNDAGLLTVADLAEKLQLSQSKVRTLYREEKIPAIRVSYRNIRFDYSDVMKALKTTGYFKNWQEEN